MKYHHNITVYRYLLLSELQLRLCSHLDSCEVLREESEEDGQVWYRWPMSATVLK